jgi:hypothetical protein
MSSTSVVAAAGPATSTPRGPAIDVFNFSCGHHRTCRQHPLWAHHRCLQLQWWPLPDLPPAPPGGPPSTSSTSVVVTTGPYRQHPLGGPPSTSSTSVVAAAGPYRQHPPWGLPSMSSTACAGSPKACSWKVASETTSSSSGEGERHMSGMRPLQDTERRSSSHRPLRWVTIMLDIGHRAIFAQAARGHYGVHMHEGKVSSSSLSPLLFFHST